MSLFDFLQFGKIGADDQTIAEIVQGMYFEGYDFIHFCSSDEKDCWQKQHLLQSRLELFYQVFPVY